MIADLGTLGCRYRALARFGRHVGIGYHARSSISSKRTPSEWTLSSQRRHSSNTSSPPCSHPACSAQFPADSRSIYWRQSGASFAILPSNSNLPSLRPALWVSPYWRRLLCIRSTASNSCFQRQNQTSPWTASPAEPWHSISWWLSLLSSAYSLSTIGYSDCWSHLDSASQIQTTQYNRGFCRHRSRSSTSGFDGMCRPALHIALFVEPSLYFGVCLYEFIAFGCCRLGWFGRCLGSGCWARRSWLIGMSRLNGSSAGLGRFGSNTPVKMCCAHLDIAN